jgi:tryptophan synthase alpha chain
VERLAAAGAAGFILPDLPIEEAAELHELASGRGLDPIMLMTPTNSDARLRQLGKAARGFVYAVARKGVTGGHTEMNRDVIEFLARCRAATNLPLALGFGVSTPADIAFIALHAEIAIIGTAALRAWEQRNSAGLREFFRELNLPAGEV